MSQCTPLENYKKIKVDKPISSLKMNESDIYAILKQLNQIKSLGWDKSWIRKIKLCSKFIIYPLKLISETSLQEGKCPDSPKKTNAVPVHKKGNKKFIKKYRAISLLAKFGKIFEKITFKDLFNYFHKNKLFR